MSAESLLIELPLTGQRSYVHGADIFDAVVARTGATADIALVLRTATDCAFELVDPETPGTDAEIFGTIRYRLGADPHRRLLRRRRDLPVTTRFALDEAGLTQGAEYGDGRALLPAGPGSLMRRAVSAAIVMLKAAAEGYWTIAEVGCRVAPPRDVATEVTLSPFLGGRYWKVMVAPRGEEPIGSITLARGSPRR